MIEEENRAKTTKIKNEERRRQVGDLMIAEDSPFLEARFENDDECIGGHDDFGDHEVMKKKK